ncbi:hypothetical protein MKW92_025549 [Papaver armeniacum]|nr:hypothetical protein MKW92_025549 [Papaver armeniacum]
MNREPPKKSLGFFGIYMDTCKFTVSWIKLCSQIFLATILPLTILYMSDIQLSYFIQNHTYQNNEKARWIAFGITKFVYLILSILFYLFSTSSVAYAVSCFYTSKDPNFKRVVGVFPKVWGRLLITFLLFFFILAICTIVYLGLLLGLMARLHGGARVALIICLSIPYIIVLIYITNVWNIAMVISVLEKDYGRKALVKSMRLIKGKIWVSSALFTVLAILFTAVIFGFVRRVVPGKTTNLGVKIFVGIVCYVLAAYLLHFYLVIQAVVYFVCKAYHNEDVSNVAEHLDVSYGNLIRGNEEV